MSAHSMVEQNVDRSRFQAAMRGLRLLVGGYLTISVVTLAVIILLRNNASIVNSAVWIRGTIVACTSILMFVYAAVAAQGSRRAYRRLRLMSGGMVVAIAVIISLPGTFPTWLKIEQGACGLILLAVVVIANGKQLRSLFATS
jgi:hypothetical protein